MGDAPDDFLEHLVALLGTNLTSTEPLNVSEVCTIPGARQASLVNQNQTRIKTSRIHVPACETYAFEALTDIDIRNMTLECIHAMCVLSYDLSIRFAEIPYLMPLLLRIVASKVMKSDVAGYEAGNL